MVPNLKTGAREGVFPFPLRWPEKWMPSRGSSRDPPTGSMLSKGNHRKGDHKCNHDFTDKPQVLLGSPLPHFPIYPKGLHFFGNSKWGPRIIFQVVFRILCQRLSTDLPKRSRNRNRGCFQGRRAWGDPFVSSNPKLLVEQPGAANSFP